MKSGDEIIKLAKENSNFCSFGDLLAGLREFTKECKWDMHEPDEEGITAVVFGDSFDNAFGEAIMDEGAGFQEMVVVLYNEDKDTIFKINLASLVAIARQAKLTDESENIREVSLAELAKRIKMLTDEFARRMK